MTAPFFSPARGWVIQLGVAMLLALAPVAAAAHSFTTLIVGPDDDPAALEAVVDGFRLATRERDGHPDETSDGHLGGLDVHITARGAGEGVDDNAAAADFVLVAGDDALFQAVAHAAGPHAIVLRPGQLPPEAVWTGAVPGGADFAGRFRDAFGRPPDRAAAEGYNAARRIDAAVRPIGSPSDRAALAAALETTASGIAW